MAVTNETTDNTLDLLEARLQRISYALHGDDESQDASTTTQRSANSTAAIRLRDLERQMHSLASKSPAVDEVLRLQSKHPDVFKQPTSEHSNTLPLAPQAALVLSHAQLYSRVSCQLTSLQETAVPDSASASKLRELHPRITKAAARQEQQAKELAELRSRSAAAVERWYETGVLGMAERWAEWEERMRDVEIIVRRLEATKKRQEELV